MSFLYHRVPENQKGDRLYPLNRLKDVYPDVYAEEAEKYSWRKRLLRRRIPILNCLWNDVLHFTAVHPAEMKKALVEAGSHSNFEMRCYQVNPFTLDQEKLVVYLYQYDDENDVIDARNIKPFRSDELPELAHIPDGTKSYFREEFKKGNRPLIFHGVPHILYKGVLNTGDLQVIST